MNRLALTSTTCAFLAVLGTSTLPAHAVSLGSLISTGGTLTDINGDVFSNFSYLNSTALPTNAVPTPASQIQVNLSAISPTGIAFSGSFNAFTGQIFDYVLGYTVTAARSTVITGLTLSDVGTSTSPGFASVVEAAYSGGTQVAVLAVSTAPNTPRNPSVNFNPGYTQLTVQKDINLDGNASGTAQISIIDQLISTGPGTNIPSVPEPSEVLGTIAFGAVGVCSYLRRLQLKKQAEPSI